MALYNIYRGRDGTPVPTCLWRVPGRGGSASLPYATAHFQARVVVPAREGLASAALYRVPVRQTGPYLSAHASVPEAGGHHLRIPAPPALEPHMGVFPLRPLDRTARHRVHTRVHTSNAHSTRPPPRFHLSASTSFHLRLVSNPPVRHPCLPISSLVVLLVDPLLHRFLALDFTILKAWDYWEAPRGSLKYSWGWRCWRVVVCF